MPDIGLIWDLVRGRGDWATPAQEPAPGGDLAAAVLVSLFTDRRASADFVLTDGTTNRRGWWADAYQSEPIGSRLWQLDRSKRLADTLLVARDMCIEALGWLLRDGIATNVDIRTFWASRTALGIRIRVTQANGVDQVIDTSLPWGVA